MISKQKGDWGENRVSAYLFDKGYEILKRKFRLRQFEVDIICKKDRFLVFVEVKTWYTYDIDSLEFAINSAKQKKMRLAANTFLLQNPGYGECKIRFDLVFLSGKTGELNHIENAF